MTLMKAPRLERKHLMALKVLVRLDYARAVRHRMETLKTKPENSFESTTKLLALTDLLSEAEQPILITLAMMDMYNSEQVWMPLVDERFDFYVRTINVDLSVDDFKVFPPNKKHKDPPPLEELVEPIRQLRLELIEIFNNADYVDPKKLNNREEVEFQPAYKN